MSKKELLEKINNLPDDSKVDIQIPLTINGQQTELRRNVDYVNLDPHTNQIILGANWGVTFRF